MNTIMNQSEVIKIFVGCDPNNCDLEQMMVLEYSIKKHSQNPIEIHWMQISHDSTSPWFVDQNNQLGWHTEKWSTPFSGFRWAIPELCNFKGRAIYMDADVIVLCDINELWNHPISDNAIVAAKGGKSVARLCTCVWDCEKAKEHIPTIIDMQSDADSHKKMMKIIKEHPELVQEYQNSYNCIDGESLDIKDIKILHYSDMGTQFSHKYALPRLKTEGQNHWFDGEILPHPRQDLIHLFDQYYQEALAEGYQLENYKIKPYGTFIKASQNSYRGNQITRPKKFRNFFSKIFKSAKKDHFKLDS
jgi:hypothetical protein